MYERFYQLRERPFALSPDPEYLYPSRVHQEALDYLRYGLESQAGFIVITGEIGSGKTTLLQTLLRHLDNQTTVGRIVNTMLEPRELLETIMIDFGLDPTGKSKPLLLRDLSQYLVDQRLAGRLVLLVIDEAQNLGLGALEELRMLSNLETEKSKLLQIVLVGQPNLRDKLAAPELEQLRQRITVSYHLPPLDQDETYNYINHRLRHAAVGTPLTFARPSTDIVHARSRGVPRIINVICDATLVFGYAEERREFDPPMIQDVLAELQTTGILPVPSRVEGPAVSEPAKTSESNPPAVSELAKTSEWNPPAVSEPAKTPEWNPAAAAAVPAPAVQAAPVPVAVLSAEHAARDLTLERREREVRQRELELAEQRRVLAEEYRIMRARRETATPAPPVAVPTNGRLRVQVAGAGVSRYDAAPPETFWARIKRFMLGNSASQES
jgi:putative secretion ATPase (PEP-CTERM system associated)